jgi:hypothetical protein
MNSYTGSKQNTRIMAQKGSVDGGMVEKVTKLFDQKGSVDEDVEKVTKLFAQQNIHVVPSKRLQEISPKEREDSLYAVHGVTKLVEETPDFVQTKITLLKLELDTTSGDHSASHQGYDLAVQQSPEFVERQLLCFLRAESFDTSKAASRCLQHFQMKLEYFGFERLGKELDLNDLDEIDRQALEAGAVQVLKVKDRSGRSILVQFAIVARKYRASVLVS